MRILFISTWSSDNGLSRSTVQPHLVQLATYENVESIHYISIEQTLCNLYTENSGKVIHIPLVIPRKSGGLISRVADQLNIRKFVLEEAKELEPNIVICRGAQAGALGCVIWKRHVIPYYVESFEPHAKYMVESGIWRRYGFKYLVQQNWEKTIKRTATRLITVSEGYARWLIENEQISPDRLRTVPCWVDKETFHFDPQDRKITRDSLDVRDSLVCVYLGQFGGLYYDVEAFNALTIIRDTIQCDVHFLLLTPDNENRIKRALDQQGLRESKYSLLYVDHTDIPGYLSAADFAVSFHRSNPMAFSFSPIKYGEYWS